VPSDEQKPTETNSSRAHDAVTALFVIPPKEDHLFTALNDAIARANKPFNDVARALRVNIEGLLSTVSMPYKLAFTSSLHRHWQRIHSAQRIRSLAMDERAEYERLSAPVVKPKPEETEDARERRHSRDAFERASAEMSEFVRSAEGKVVLNRDTLNFLENLQTDDSIRVAANELILQGIVLCWGAFEVLARDCFIAHLNANPSCTIALLSDPIAKRRFELSKISLETLAAHDFDLSGRMGNLLALQQDLSDINSVKAIYQALFPKDAKLSDALSDLNLRLLSLRRNLIIHQRGIVDSMYKDSTNCSQVVGARVAIFSDDLSAHLVTTIRASTTILDAVSGAKCAT
jgi:hypothetical protein